MPVKDPVTSLQGRTVTKKFIDDLNSSGFFLNSNEFNGIERLLPY